MWRALCASVMDRTVLPTPMSSDSPPGRALIGATVHTMRTPDETATAIAWQEGRIALVGDDAAVRAWAREHGVEVEDAAGKTIIPGFVDAHTHFLHVGIKQERPDLRKAASLADALSSVAAWLETAPEGPVIAEGWDEENWPEARRPTKAELDALAPDRALVMRRICGHVAIANSAALPAIRARWPDAQLVDERTGVLLEQPSLYLNEVLPASDALLEAGLQRACETAHRLGVTAVGDYEQQPLYDALRRAAAAGTLTVRVAVSIYTQQLEEVIAAGFRTGRQAPGPGGPSAWLQDAGLKVFLDGSLGGHTAHLRDRYVDEDTVGMPNWTDEDVRRWFQMAQDAGIQIHAHAIGDAAIDQGLDAYAAIGPDANLRHRFEHYEIVHDDQIQRTAKLGIVASSQPNFVGAWSTKGGMYEERLGARFLLNNRFRSFIDGGLRLAFGSDGMPFGPLYGLQSAVDHPVPEQRLRAAEAVWHYTREAAWSLHLDVGCLESGRPADLLVLDVPNLDAKAPQHWTILETITDGTTRHEGRQPAVRDE